MMGVAGNVTSAPGYIKQAIGLSSEQNLSAKEVEMFNWIDMKEEDRKDQLLQAHLDSGVLKDIQAETLFPKE